jgi:hypothetical protein
MRILQQSENRRFGLGNPADLGEMESFGELSDGANRAGPTIRVP